MGTHHPAFDRNGRTATPNWADVISECVDHVPVIEASGGLGAGLLCSADGLVLTNTHVAGHDDLTVVFKDGTRVNALPVYEHRTLDLTLVQAAIGHRGFFDLPARLATQYQAGEEVLAIGHPRGLTHSPSRGIISHERRLIRDHAFVQTDVAINPGNSGGPLLDPQGRLVGINTETVADSQGLSLAIPVDDVFAFWNDFVHNAGRLGRRVANATEVGSRIRPRTPSEIVKAAASLADCVLGESQNNEWYATTRSGRAYLVSASESFFSVTHHLGTYKSPALPLQWLRWQARFQYIRFWMEDQRVYLGCWREFQDLDVSEAARTMTEIASALDNHADTLRQYLGD